MGRRPGEHQYIENGDEAFRPEYSGNSESERELDQERQEPVIHAGVSGRKAGSEQLVRV